MKKDWVWKKWRKDYGILGAKETARIWVQKTGSGAGGENKDGLSTGREDEVWAERTKMARVQVVRLGSKWRGPKRLGLQRTEVFFSNMGCRYHLLLQNCSMLLKLRVV